MLHVTDAMIDRHVTAADAQAAMLEAFQSFGRAMPRRCCRCASPTCWHCCAATPRATRPS